MASAPTLSSRSKVQLPPAASTPSDRLKAKLSVTGTLTKKLLPTPQSPAEGEVLMVTSLAPVISLILSLKAMSLRAKLALGLVTV